MIVALICLAIALAAMMAAIALRWRPSTLPGWPPKDWRALLALIASIAGAGILTGFAAWLVWILWRGGWPVATAPMRVAALARALMLALLIIGAVLLSLGLAINRRSIRLGRDGFEASGGDEEERP